MRIGIIGTGALASLFAARLAPLANVTLVGSWQAQIDAINANGITVLELDGSETRVAVAATSQPQRVEPVDVALILTKSYQTVEAVARAEMILAEHGAAVTLQNGLGNLELLIDEFGADRATIGVTLQGAALEQLGVVRHAGNGATHLAQATRHIKRTGGLISYLRAAGLELYVTRDADALIWRKLAINAGINPVSALLDRPNGELPTDPIARRIMQQAAQEVANVAHAQDIEIGDVASEVITVAETTASNRSSMLQDITRGTPTEIDAICGAVVQRGQALNVPTPVNHALHQAIIQLESNSAATRESLWQFVTETLTKPAENL